MENPSTQPTTEEPQQSKADKPKDVLRQNLTSRIQFANSLLAEFEALRMRALDTKVPKPYQKRWQYDSNLFFKLVVRTNQRLNRMEKK